MEKKKKNLNNMGPLSGHCEITITGITCILQDNFDLFSDIISFQHVLHFDVGRSEIEWNMKVIMEKSFYIGPKARAHPDIRERSACATVEYK